MWIDGKEWKLVPVEPTDEMYSAGWRARHLGEESLWDVYRAMIDAAPAERAAQAAPSDDDLRLLWEETYFAEPETMLGQGVIRFARALLARYGRAAGDAEYPQAAKVCAELYQVIGSLASDLGVFDHPKVVKALDNAADHALVHDDVLPFPSFEHKTAGEAQHSGQSAAPKPTGIAYELALVLSDPDSKLSDEAERAIAFAVAALRAQPAASAEPPYEIDALFDALSNLEHDNYERSYSGSKNREADAGLIRAALERYAAPVAAQAPQHPDDEAVDRFAAAMKAKLAKKRADGRGGWNDKTQCSQELLSRLLSEHVEKGDPVDVGNFAMMLHQRGERITAQAPAADADARDAARWRYIRRKLCLTGNGDGTCAMQAINLPAAIQGWPEPGQVAEFCDAAIDAAMSKEGRGDD